MSLAEIFQAIEETRLLKTLSRHEKIFFVGETEPIKYIQDFFASCKQADSNFYYDLSAYSLKDIYIFLSKDVKYRAIVVVSVVSETSLFSEVQQKLSSLKIEIPIIRLFADIFINLMCHRDLLQLTSNQLIKPKTSYAIMTTPRSGSTYFCDLLTSTEIAGYPIEHLRLANQELALNCDFDYFKLLFNLMHHRVSDNQVFGTKIISHFLFELRKARPKFRNIFKLIDKYVLLVRQDKVAQAVSLVIAQKTAVWHIQKNNSQEDAGDRTYKSALENI
ncbi:MAG: Stf0 family sulfotransferase, partial [Pleurocapsa sp.]